MTSDLLVSESPWWMVTFPLFIDPLNHPLTCFYDHKLLWIRVGRFYRYGSGASCVLMKPHHSLFLSEFISWFNHTATRASCVIFILLHILRSHTASIYVSCSASSNRKRNPFRVYRAKIERLYPRRCWKNNLADAQCLLCKIEDWIHITCSCSI